MSLSLLAAFIAANFLVCSVTYFALGFSWSLFKWYKFISENKDFYKKNYKK